MFFSFAYFLGKVEKPDDFCHNGPVNGTFSTTLSTGLGEKIMGVNHVILTNHRTAFTCRRRPCGRALPDGPDIAVNPPRLL